MNIVIGAGMAGMGAYFANPDNTQIYEKNNYAGGLCAGFEIKGFRFDQAVHLSFTEDVLVRSLFDRTEQYSHHPVPYSWYHERWLQHPAQNNLYPLPIEEKIKAIKDFVNKEENLEEDNFEDWSKSHYGEYLWKTMFQPYNKKYWCVSLKELSTDWLGNRFYQPTLDEILYGSYTDQTPNTYYAKEMRYPCEGGYFSFVSNLVEEAESKGCIHYANKVIQILPQSKEVTFLDEGRAKKVKYSTLYSSVPLPEMMEIIDTVPIDLKEKSMRLEHTGVVLVSIGMKKSLQNDKMWFYIYDLDIVAARAYFPGVKAPSNVPTGCSSIQFEIYFNGKDAAPEEKECINNCIYALEKLGIAERADILFADYRKVEYGNVIFKKETKIIVEELTAWLRKAGIIPIGRFGRWEYFWSDQAFLSGYYELLNQN